MWIGNCYTLQRTLTSATLIIQLQASSLNFAAADMLDQLISKYPRPEEPMRTSDAVASQPASNPGWGNGGPQDGLGPRTPSAWSPPDTPMKQADAQAGSSAPGSVPTEADNSQQKGHAAAAHPSHDELDQLAYGPASCVEPSALSSHTKDEPNHFTSYMKCAHDPSVSARLPRAKRRRPPDSDEEGACQTKRQTLLPKRQTSQILKLMDTHGMPALASNSTACASWSCACAQSEATLQPVCHLGVKA